ncbi:hypothetical protein BEL04_12150 [Mucilaginibacter sp. PPCGB 2223]|uniref:hypothetical protein n=1 Tax=Mucilaginibacter sp. PPCGB 2223 TaxID=1886027 RepID=UPI0008263FC9|nr:hypothetical protein [Mucilaginibacter sp. PPCGB 2223]OCX52229.1 hypothetical protein BEL04_12150 [Mucilaginibacter sp. PPCGB 2223]
MGDIVGVALGIAADTGPSTDSGRAVANASRWVSGQVAQYERIARAAGNALIIIIEGLID